MTTPSLSDKISVIFIFVLELKSINDWFPNPRSIDEGISSAHAMRCVALPHLAGREKRHRPFLRGFVTLALKVKSCEPSGDARCLGFTFRCPRFRCPPRGLASVRITGSTVRHEHGSQRQEQRHTFVSVTSSKITISERSVSRRKNEYEVKQHSGTMALDRSRLLITVQTPTATAHSTDTQHLSSLDSTATSAATKILSLQPHGVCSNAMRCCIAAW